MFNIHLIPLTFCLTTFLHCSIANEQQQTTDDNDLKTQESLDTFGGALGPLRAHLEPLMLVKNGPTTAYDDYHKYGGIGGQKLLLAPIAHLTSHDGSSLMDGYKNYYGDSEYLDQGLNKYSGHHKRDKYGAKSDTHKDFHDTHVYTRNRGYGYEKHYMFDKEYSTGKKVGTNKGKHSFFGDHDHGSKVTIDAHKNYDSKKYSNKNLAAVDPYEPIGIISNNHHNNDYSIIDDHIDQGLSDNGYHDGGKTNLLNKHKKELHKIKKHFENHHHIHHSPQPIAYAKVHEYIPVIESYGGIVPTSVPSTSTYGTHSLIEPYEHKYYPKSAYTIQPIHQSPESSLYDDTLYLSSASDDQKTNQYIKPNMDTEGESVNTLNARLLSTSQSGSALSTSSSSALPTSSSIPITTASKSAKIVNTAPLISTRLMPIVDGSAASLSSSTSTSTTTTLSTLTNPRIALAESSFPKIQSAVHATPAIIATHMYKH